MSRVHFIYIHGPHDYFRKARDKLCFHIIIQLINTPDRPVIISTFGLINESLYDYICLHIWQIPIILLFTCIEWLDFTIKPTPGCHKTCNYRWVHKRRDQLFCQVIKNANFIIISVMWLNIYINDFWSNTKRYIAIYHLETLIGWKWITWRSIKSSITRTLLIIATTMQYTKKRSTFQN
jgi:hypothetical protein